MGSPSPPASVESRSDSGRDERLARLLEALIQQSRHGRRPDLEQVVAVNPDLSAELRELWATAMIAEDFGSFCGDSPTVPATPSQIHADEARPARPGPPLPARIGEYEILEELGRGGMGVVYKARQHSLRRVVALKMILRGDLASAADVARFRAEAESAARLNHPHIVPVYEVGEHDGQPYFSMKYIEGTNLARRLIDGPLPPRNAAEMLVPVADAIAEAHRHGLLHRDLKPSNILIDDDGRPYVSDFGLAKQFRSDSPLPRFGGEGPGVRGPSASEICERSETRSPSDTGFLEAAASLTQSGAILGTPGYMAPEQAAGHRGAIGPATDVYSLGAILYALLTGRAPFQAASPVDTVLMVLEQDPLPPRLLNPRADPDLEMIALKCLQKPADLRYGSASDLAADLRAYLANEPISARSTHFTQVLSRAFRETHHAGVLENWGLLWMLHGLVVLVLALVTNLFQWWGVTSRLPYMGLWVVGLSLWAALFWELRRRSGPITFVERQIAHVWAGSMAASTGLYVVEWLLGLHVLALSPVLGLVSGMVFLAKAGILSGAFYIQAVVLFATAPLMAWIARADIPDFSISLFGVVSALAFFVPGLKYYRQRERSRSDG